MADTPQSKGSLRELIRKIEADHILTEDELRQMHIEVMRDGVVTEEERQLFTEAVVRLRRRRQRDNM